MNEEVEKYGENSSYPQFCTNNFFTAIAVLQHFCTENNAGWVTIKLYCVEAVLPRNNLIAELKRKTSR